MCNDDAVPLIAKIVCTYFCTSMVCLVIPVISFMVKLLLHYNIICSGVLFSGLLLLSASVFYHFVIE